MTTKGAIINAENIDLWRYTDVRKSNFLFKLMRATVIKKKKKEGIKGDRRNRKKARMDHL